MKVLVTGGAGYIGSHVVNQLGKEDYEIVVLDNLSTGRKDAILAGELVEQSLENYQAVDNLLAVCKFDAILHFAGSIVVPESVTDPIKYYKNNTENSLNLIQLAVKHGVKHFIFSSTAAVYGMPEDGAASEESKLAPINPYGTSKLMTEMMLKDICAATSLNYVALRYFNVAGASTEGKIGQSTPNATHLLKIACETACGKREGMSIFGTDYDTADGTCIRDYIHVDDLARAHLDALTYLAKGGKSDVFNCGYGQGYSVREIIDTVKKVTGVDFKVEESPRRGGDPAELKSIASKIRETLGWAPQNNDIELIVKTAYEWEKKL